MKNLKSITVEDINKLNPCYDPITVLDPSKSYNAISIIDCGVKIQDSVWVICRPDYVSDELSRAFSIWCAQNALNNVSNADPRSIEALKLAKSFINKEITPDDLNDARGEAITAWNEAHVKFGKDSREARAAESVAHTCDPTAGNAAYYSALASKISFGIGGNAQETIMKEQFKSMITTGIDTGDSVLA